MKKTKKIKPGQLQIINRAYISSTGLTIMCGKIKKDKKVENVCNKISKNIEMEGCSDDSSKKISIIYGKGSKIGKRKREPLNKILPIFARIIVTKKEGNAVHRNKIKRRIKSAIKLSIEKDLESITYNQKNKYIGFIVFAKKDLLDVNFKSIMSPFSALKLKIMDSLNNS